MDAPFPKSLVPAWEEFLSRPRTLDDLFRHPVLFPLQRRREMEAMFATTGDAPHAYMEIGSDKGGSLWAWLWAWPSLRRIIACEVRGTPYSHLFEAAFPHVKFLWLPQSSYERAAADCTRSWLGRDRLDVLFIDGDKLGFRRDWDAYRPMVREGGVVFLHDITDKYANGGGPGDVWRALRATGLAAGRESAFSEVIDVSEVEPALDRQENGAELTEHENWLCTWKGRSCGVGVIRV